MKINTSAIPSASVSKNTQHRQLLLLKVWQYFIVKHVGCCDGCFRCVELGKCHLAVGINKGLLVDTANSFKVTHIKRVL